MYFIGVENSYFSYSLYFVLLHLNTASDYLAPFLEEASSWKVRFPVYLLEVKFIDKKSFT